MDDKNTIRKQMKALQRALSDKERRLTGQAVEKQLFLMPEFQKCCIFFTYLSYRTEIPTHELINSAIAAGKTVAAPKVTGDGTMVFYQIDSLQSCVPGAFGIPEPQGGRVLTPEMADSFLLLPGLAFTRTGKRLGYGGGYYDRYLNAYSEAFRAAPAYPFSVLEDIPTAEHDMRADAVILPTGVIYTSAGNESGG